MPRGESRLVRCGLAPEEPRTDGERKMPVGTLSRTSCFRRNLVGALLSLSVALPLLRCIHTGHPSLSAGLFALRPEDRHRVRARGNPANLQEMEKRSQTPHDDLVTHTRVCVGERPSWGTRLWVNFNTFPSPIFSGFLVTCIFFFFI